jgi:gas vesicle protein
VEFILTYERQGFEGLINDAVLFNRMDWSSNSENWDKENKQNQEEIEELIKELIPKVSNIKSTYKQELSDISKSASSGAKKSVDGLKNIIMKQQVQFIVQKLAGSYGE